LRAAGAGGRKRRKLNKGKAVDVAPGAGKDGGFVDDGAGAGFLDDDGVEGGFVDDDDDNDDAGGGFMLDDDEAGGFLPDDAEGGGGGFMLDDGDDDDEMGGFVGDDGPSTTATTTRTNTRPTTPAQNARIPLHVLPGLLGSLDLPTDEDVLAVFRASATGWDDDADDADRAGDNARRRKRGEAGEDDTTGGGVGKRDFRAVCAALMGPDDQPDGAEDAEVSSDDASDTFELDDAGDESSLSDASSEESYGRGKAAGRAKGGAKGVSTPGTRRGRKNKALEEDERVKLSSRQREMVAAIWAMIKPAKPTSGPQRGGMVLGRDELKVVVRDFGEMWTDEEVSAAMRIRCRGEERNES